MKELIVKSLKYKTIPSYTLIVLYVVAKDQDLPKNK